MEKCTRHHMHMLLKKTQFQTRFVALEWLLRITVISPPDYRNYDQ